MKPVASFYHPGVAGKHKLDPTIDAIHGSFPIGYGASGSPSFKFTMDRRPVDQAVDVGFLKIFLATFPVDLSNVPQMPPFTQAPREAVEAPRKTAMIWDTILIPVVQRRTVV